MIYRLLQKNEPPIAESVSAICKIDSRGVLDVYQNEREHQCSSACTLEICWLCLIPKVLNGCSEPFENLLKATCAFLVRSLYCLQSFHNKLDKTHGIIIFGKCDTSKIKLKTSHDESSIYVYNRKYQEILLQEYTSLFPRLIIYI